MEEHPIGGLMKTTMENLKEMADVSTIVGEAVETADGTVIIPISRLSFGFLSGGSDYCESGSESQEQNSKPGSKNNGPKPFGGGSGGGMNVQPVAMLVVGQGQVRLLPVDSHAMLDRIIDLAPGLFSQIQSMLQPQPEQPDPPEKKGTTKQRS